MLCVSFLMRNVFPQEETCLASKAVPTLWMSSGIASTMLLTNQILRRCVLRGYLWSECCFEIDFSCGVCVLGMVQWVEGLIDESLFNWRSRRYDDFQRFTNNIL